MFETKVVEKKHFYVQKLYDVYEIMWKNTVKPDRLQITVWYMRTACWIPNATDTHSEYIVLIDFPLQQWLHECSSDLCLYVHCLACLCLFAGNAAKLYTKYVFD